MKRILQFPLDGINYKSLLKKNMNNLHYRRNKNKLRAWYFYNKYGIREFLYILRKNTISQFFIILNKEFPKIETELLNILGIPNTSEKYRNQIIFYILKKKNNCKTCNVVLYNDRTYCSNKCSNSVKNRDPDFIKKVSLGNIKAHRNMSIEQKQNKNQKIKMGVELYNSLLTDEERKEKYSNFIPNLTAFDSFIENNKHFNIQCDKDYFYNNRDIPVGCVNCDNKWTVTKTTGYSRLECRVCTPYNKHKTQNTIAEYIMSVSTNIIINDRSVIYPKEIDIVCDDYCVEFNGLMTHSIGNSDVKWFNNMVGCGLETYHLYKTNEVESKGKKLYHILENEWNSNRKLWESVLNTKKDRVFARKTIVKEVDSKEAREFIDLNHLQGNCNASIRIGLYYGEELIQIMTFSKSRFNKHAEYELIRMCSKMNLVVVGGASKLLKYFEINYKPKSLLSYANRRWSQGNVYDKLGFKFIENTRPNHFYFTPSHCPKMYSRQTFQKHKIKEMYNKGMLDYYDENKSGVQNMIDNNYRIIYDSGNKKYIKTYNWEN